jgi:WD40 repeat protein
MSQPSRIEALLSRWQKLRAAGETLSAERLCEDCPELAAEVRPVLEALRWLEPVGAASQTATLARAYPPPPLGSGCQATLPPSRSPDAPALPAPDGYEILGQLGRGGMGVVYHARHTKLGRPVALKMILSGKHAGEQELARFKTEAEVIARLGHPNIVQIFEVGEHDGLPFQSLEYCPGGTLERKLHGAPLPPKEAARLVETLARAVHAAHDKGVVHRDLKPANVLLADDGTPKIADFGLARKLDEAGQTASGSVMGTPSYMPPEQAGGKVRELGPAVDVYALGAILYECLTGRPPFLAATTYETMVQVMSEEPVPPRQLNAQVPADLETICLKCLRKEAARRYESAISLAEDLGRWLRREPILARPAGAAERVAKWARRRPAVAALLGVVALLTAGSLTAITLLYGDAVARAKEASQQRDKALEAEARENEERKKAVAERERAEQRTAMVHYAFQLAQARREAETGRLERATALLDQTQPKLRGWEFGHLRLALPHLAANSEAAKSGGRGESVAFSKDSKLLAVGLANGGIEICDVRSRKRVRRLKGASLMVWSVHFSPNGRFLASAAGEKDGEEPGEVHVWDLSTGKSQARLIGHPKNVYTVRFSPDGSWVATAGEDGTVRLWDPAFGSEVRVIHVGERVEGLDVHPDGTSLACGTANGVVICDTRTGKRLRSLPDQPNAHAVAFSGDGKLLAAAGGSDGTCIWDGTTGKLLQQLGNPGGGGVVCVAFCGKANLLAIGDAGSRTFRVAPVGPGNRARPPLHRSESRWISNEGVACSADGTMMAFTTADGVGITSFANQSTSQIDIEPNIDSASPPRASDIILPLQQFLVQTKPGGKAGHPEVVEIVEAGTGLRLASFAKPLVQDAKPRLQRTGLRFARPASQSRRRSARAIAQDIRTQDGSLHASVEQLGIVLRDAETGSPLTFLPVDRANLARLAFSPDARRLLGVGRSEIKVWDTQSGMELLQLKAPNDACEALGFDPNARCLVWLGSESLRLWRTAPVTPAQGSKVAASTEPTMLDLVIAESEQRWPDAVATADHLIRGNRGNRGLLEHCAFAMLKLERWSDAAAALMAWVGLPPRDPALGGLAPALQIFPPEPDSSAAVGLLGALDRALTAQPRAWQALAYRGWLRAEWGNLDQAADDLRAAARLANNRADLWVSLADVELSRLSDAGADEAREHLVRLAPGSLERWHQQMYGRDAGTGSAGHALWHLKQLARTKPELARPEVLADLLVRRAVLFNDNRRRKEAARDLREAAKLRPNHVDLLCVLADTLVADGDLRGYREVCRQLTRRFPKDQGDAASVVFACLLAPDALPDMGPVIKMAEWAARPDYLGGPSSVGRHGLLAGALLRAGRREEAIRYLERRPDPEDWAAHCLQLLAYRTAGRDEQAALLERQMQKPVIPLLAGTQVGSLFGGSGALSGLVGVVCLETIRQSTRLTWEDWRDLGQLRQRRMVFLPLDDGKDVFISTR